MEGTDNGQGATKERGERLRKGAKGFGDQDRFVICMEWFGLVGLSG
jgi:hypothetical protein